MLDKEAFDITRLWSEYTDHTYQCPDTYQDLYLGKIENLKSPKFYALSAIEDFSFDEAMELEGYRRNKDAATEGEEDLNVATNGVPSINIAMLNEMILNDEIDVRSNDEKKKDKMELVPISINYVKPHICHLDPDIGSKIIFTNGFTIQMDYQQPKGHSGGPVLSNGTVAGMLIGQSAAFSASYILKQIDATKALKGLAASRLAVAIEEKRDNTWLFDSTYSSHHYQLCFISLQDLNQMRNQVHAPGKAALQVLSRITELVMPII